MATGKFYLDSFNVMWGEEGDGGPFSPGPIVPPGGGEVIPDPKMAVVSTVVSSTGSIDITSSGFGTPTAAIVLMSNSAGGVATHLNSSVGATDGTNQWSVAGFADDAVAASTFNRSFHKCQTTSIVNLISEGADVALASFTSFITDGIRLNFSVKAVVIGSPRIVVILFRNVSADCGVVSPLPNTSSTTVTTGFETNALFVAAAFELFNGNKNNWNHQRYGFASWDGTTLRQLQTVAQDQDAANPTAVAGFAATGTVPLSSVDTFTATSFNVTTTADRSGEGIGYLALGGLSAWVGLVDSPTSTGTGSLTGASFTPTGAILLPKGVTTDGVLDSTSVGGYHGLGAVSSFDVTSEHCLAWSAEDNVATTDTHSDYEAASIYLLDDAGATWMNATYSAFISGGLSLSWNTVPGTARKIGCLFLQ